MSEALVQFDVTMRVTGPTDDHVTDYCILHLKDRGYNVTSATDKRETVAQFIKRLRVCHETLYRSLKERDCPPVNIRRGKKGVRIVWIISNPLFDEFVTRNKA